MSKSKDNSILLWRSNLSISTKEEEEDTNQEKAEIDTQKDIIMIVIEIIEIEEMTDTMVSEAEVIKMQDITRK